MLIPVFSEAYASLFDILNPNCVAMNDGLYAPFFFFPGFPNPKSPDMSIPKSPPIGGGGGEVVLNGGLGEGEPGLNDIDWEKLGDNVFDTDNEGDNDREGEGLGLLGMEVEGEPTRIETEPTDWEREVERLGDIEGETLIDADWLGLLLGDATLALACEIPRDCDFALGLS